MNAVEGRRNMKSYILTPDGLVKLKKELDELKKVRRPAVIERLKVARALGDLSENSEYDDARNDQSFVEGRIEELEEMIKHAKIIDKKHGNGSINLGNIIEVEIDGDKEKYELVSSIEADPASGKLSADSPIGKALLGKNKGDIALVNAPAGQLKYKILSVS